MRTISDICYNKNTRQLLDIHLPQQDTFPVFLYFHGGGFKAGDKARQSALFRYMVSHGVAVVSANYRMYPEANYPDFISDGADAVAWVLKHIDTYGKMTAFYIGGSSAGGYLSQMLCFDGTWLSDRGVQPGAISGYIHDAAQPTCHYNMLQEAGIDPRRVIVDASAPLYHVGIQEQYPPMLIIVSNDDMAGRYEQTMLLVATLKHFGHREKVTLKIMNGRHCAYVNAVDQDGQSILGKLVLDFIQSHPSAF